LFYVDPRPPVDPRHLHMRGSAGKQQKENDR